MGKHATPERAAEIVALWETGSVTHDDLASRFGMSRRGVQELLRRAGAVKGAKARALASAATAHVLATALPSPTDLAERIREVKARAYENASTIERAIMAAVTGPTVAEAAPALRALDLAASALERVRRAQWAALSVEAQVNDGEALPELPIRVMSPEEVAAIRDRHAREDGDGGGEDDEPEDTGDVIEGEDDDEAMLAAAGETAERVKS
jgi:hypothetical protein